MLARCAAELALMADFFISYTSSDRYWAHWIGKELTALDHVAHVHEWEIEGGGDIYGWMEKRLDAADHVLCVISDEYLKAPYSTLERNAALWQAAGNRPGFVLFVVVKPAKLPVLSDHIRRCELFGVPEDAARLRFREFMSQCEAPETAAFPGKVVAVSNIPIRVPEHFLGRDDSLAAIETSLARYEGRVAITTVHGLRGVPRLRPPMRKNIVAITGRPGGSGLRQDPPCAPILWRSACVSAGLARRTRRSPRSRP